MIVQSQFTPAWWIANKHLQSLWGYVYSANTKPIFNRFRIELSDGDFIDLDTYGDSKQDIVLMLHGLGGSSQSHYLRQMTPILAAEGYFVVIMNFRGASGYFNRLPRLYHGGESNDVSAVIDYLQDQYPLKKMNLIGFSLGANILLKYLGERCVPKVIEKAIAVSVPFDLKVVSQSLKNLPNHPYQKWLMNDIKRQVLAKFSEQETPIDLDKLKKLKVFWEYDELVTAPLHGFKNVHDYYQASSCKFYLDKIKTTTLIIHAKDDPLIPTSCIPKSDQLSTSTRLELSEQGGHVGFISQKNKMQSHYWLGDRVVEFLHE